MNRYTVPMQGRPAYLRGHEIAAYFPLHAILKSAESAMTTKFVLNRKLFGCAYSILHPNYFAHAHKGHGVMIHLEVISNHLRSGMTFPGDIDILIIPYEEDQLIVSDTTAIEVKVVRSSFAKQHKSPNQYGFSQAKSLLHHGFPFVAVAHLIVSDCSPVTAWRDVFVTTIADAATGRVEALLPSKADLLPVDLMSRSIGRLEKNCPANELGLIAAHLDWNTASGIFLPSGRRAARNPSTHDNTLKAIGDYYNLHFHHFIDTPAVDPE